MPDFNKRQMMQLSTQELACLEVDAAVQRDSLPPARPVVK